jgi:pilus assembly protein CpaE
MTERIQTLVALDVGVDEALLRSALPDDGGIEIIGIVDGLNESWQTLQETTADLVVVACAGYSDRAIYFIDNAVKQSRERPVVVLTTGSPNGFVRRVFESGADDIITLPEDPDRVGFTLLKALARRQGAAIASGAALGAMICVLGPKGGTGKTLTATNLAAALAQQGERTVIVDLDLQFGDVGLALGLRPDKTIHDLARSAGSLDSEKLDAYLLDHASGLKALLAPTRPDQAATVTVDFLRDVFGHLRSSADFVIVDTPPGFTPEVIAAIDSSSHVCLVGMLDSLSLKNTKLGLETLELMGYDPDRIAIVLNRSDSRVGISHEDVDAVIGRAPSTHIPSDREIPISINEGMPIVMSEERAEASKAFRGLAAFYMEQATKREESPAEAEAPEAKPKDKPKDKPRRRFARR